MSRLVIDTNVFVHSANHATGYFDFAVQFLEEFVASTWDICVDEGFDANEAQNRSRIFSEYLRCIPPQSLAREILTEYILLGKILDFGTAVPNQIRQTINSDVVDASDRVFVKVAYNSSSESLVSHDFAAFPDETRDRFSALGIANIVDCPNHQF